MSATSYSRDLAVRSSVPGSNKVAEFFGELIARQGRWVVVDYGVVQVEELHHLVTRRSIR
jgi:hypothetical protein